MCLQVFPQRLSQTISHYMSLNSSWAPAYSRVLVGPCFILFTAQSDSELMILSFPSAQASPMYWFTSLSTGLEHATLAVYDFEALEAPAFSRVLGDASFHIGSYTERSQFITFDFYSRGQPAAVYCFAV